jgi:hypothetical protein
VTEVRLEDRAGAQRRQYLAGEPFVVLLHVHVDPSCPPPQVALEFHLASGVLVAAATQELAELGWDRSGGEGWLRFELDSLPLADGRFEVAVSLSDPVAGHLYHRRLAAAGFAVYSEEGPAPGLVRLEGRWLPAGDTSTVSAA